MLFHARPAFWLSSPARPFNPKQLARSRLGKAAWIVLFRSNFRFFRVEDRPRVEQKTAYQSGTTHHLAKPHRLSTHRPWLDDLAQIPNLKPQIPQRLPLILAFGFNCLLSSTELPVQFRGRKGSLYRGRAGRSPVRPSDRHARREFGRSSYPYLPSCTQSTPNPSVQRYQRSN
jgi:hypothetical protein